MPARVCPLIAALACASPLYATDSWQCIGDAPDWRLDFDTAQARFVFPAPTEMEVVQHSAAEGRDWPRAFTLIGARDTAIVVLEDQTCTTSGGPQPLQIHVLTQRGQTPILLTGCCAPR